MIHKTIVRAPEWEIVIGLEVHTQAFDQQQNIFRRLHHLVVPSRTPRRTR